MATEIDLMIKKPAESILITKPAQYLQAKVKAGCFKRSSAGTGLLALLLALSMSLSGLSVAESKSSSANLQAKSKNSHAKSPAYASKKGKNLKIAAADSEGSEKSKDEKDADSSGKSQSKDEGAAAASKSESEADKDEDKSEKKSKDDKSKEKKKQKEKAKKEKTKKADKNKDKEAKDQKSEKSEKSEKSDKDSGSDKDKKKPDEEQDKKKGSGIFHLGGKKKDAEAPPADAAKSKQEAESAKKDEAKEAQAKESKAVDPNAPRYKVDPALISVLKDISKALKDSDAVKALEDPAQKLAADLAAQALAKALAAPELTANRIVAASDKEGGGKTMAAEAWESGPIDVSSELKASVLALWAKKSDGLLSLQIVGDYTGAVPEGQESLGEFIVLITARSAVDKGFDIQTQQEVNFWIGKVAELKIECGGKSSGQKDLKSLLNYIHVPLTQRKRDFLLALNQYENKLAEAEKEKNKQAEIAAALAIQQKQVAETLARKVAEALAKSVGAEGLAVAGGDSSQKKSEGASDLAKAGSDAPVPHPPTASELGSEAFQPKKDEANPEPEKSELVKLDKDKSRKQAGDFDAARTSSLPEQSSSSKSGPDAGSLPAKATLPAPLSSASSSSSGSASSSSSGSASGSSSGSASSSNSGSASSTIASIFPDASGSSRSAWDSPAGNTETRSPSPSATLLYPARALAGHYITCAVLNQEQIGEGFVGLTFNGAKLSTAENGKIVYQVPEDTSPGYSLHLAMSARPEQGSAAIEILQPLSRPSDAQFPNLETVSTVCTSGGLLTISGHNFDGIAERNRVIIDGSHDANVVVSSPVQLKARVPASVGAGQHTVCVSTSGLRSNPGNFDLVSVEISASGPDTSKNDLKKLMVKVSGTQNRVRVKLVNQSRDIIRMIKGDELVVVTSGGAQNQTVIPVQRLRSGTYKIDAEILI